MIYGESLSKKITEEIKSIISTCEETSLKCDDCSLSDEDLIKLAWIYNLEEKRIIIFSKQIETTNLDEYI